MARVIWGARRVCVWVKRVEIETSRSRALRATRPHTVGYIRGGHGGREREEKGGVRGDLGREGEEKPEGERRHLPQLPTHNMIGEKY